VIIVKYLLWPVATVFNFWPRQQLVLLPALLGALVYAALAGFAVSTLRAFIMLSVYVVCRLLARDVPLLKVLLIAVVLLLLLDPFSILDVGFWLSCGAVLIIAIAAHYFGNLTLVRLQPLLWLGMIPMTSLFFGQVSLVSPLVNLVVVPLFCVLVIPLVLVSLLLLKVGLSSLSTMLLAGLATGLESFNDVIIHIGNWPFARVFPSEFQFWQIAIVSVTVFYYLGRWSIRHIVALITFIAVALWPVRQLAEGEVEVALLDVGQGLAMVIEVADQVIVYDTGPAFESGFNAAEAVLIPFLRHRGIRHIDRLIVSHADNDHIGGFTKLQEAFKIDQILTSRVDKIPSAIACQAGTSWTSSGVRFSIISPDRNTPPGSNNHSCVLRIDNGRYRFLITGDIEKSVERHLLESSLSLSTDILLVPHQGSKTSSTEQFIAATKPKLGLIAAGYRNHYGHPHENVVARYHAQGVELLSTVESGTILLNLNYLDWSTRRYRFDNKRFWHRQKKPN
jgi:competence protein ComEC